MLRKSDVRAFTVLVGVLAVSFLIALAGMCAQIAWLGQTVGWEAGWVGDISAGIFTAAMIATFVFAASKQEHDLKTTPREPRGSLSH